MADSKTQEKVQQALKDLEQGVAKLVTEQDWIEYLRVQSTFHDYSFGNVMLIAIQRPGATQVAGFKAWKKLGRNVLKGEKGIAILAPMTRKATDENTGEERRWISGFRVVYVFDIAQTDGEPLPSHPSRLLDEGDADADMLEMVKSLIMAEGFTYKELQIPGSTNGFTDHLTKQVTVDRHMPIQQRVKTALHELAHVIMHSPEDVDYQARRGYCEIEAESTAYVVLHALGYDAGAYSFGYVAGWSDSKPERVKHVGENIARTSRKILERLQPASNSKQTQVETVA
jgi:antirestriction protein ArdC